MTRKRNPSSRNESHRVEFASYLENESDREVIGHAEERLLLKELVVVDDGQQVAVH